jgi:hypothetical protein
MNNIKKYTNHFFDKLEVQEDLEHGHNYKAYMHQAVLEFMQNETKETAFAVYKSFFDSYRIMMPDNDKCFIDLLDALLEYEESAATLIDKQRDHYIHSVNVFILGLCIYSQNNNFRSAFNTTVLDKSSYALSYDTDHEEFFFRWGIAALFHDIGYPIEIIGKQINKFLDFASRLDSHSHIRAHLAYDNFEDINTIVELLPKKEFIDSYYKKYDSCVYIDLLKPVDLLAHKLHLVFDVDLKAIKSTLDQYVVYMAKNGFIDHGFYSALIVLKWYGYLVQLSKQQPEYFFFPILDSASAILLHNYYRNALMKPPYNLGSLSPSKDPIAFMLILCDELQEWNRQAYGILDRKLTQAADVTLTITGKRLDITYMTETRMLPESFATEKKALLSTVLDMKAVFPGGFTVGSESKHALREIAGELRQNYSVMARPLLDMLESLAIAIHQKYNEKQLELFPEKPLKYPNFSDLPDTLKYSNLRQARSIVDMIELAGWEMRPIGSEGELVTEIPKETIEVLAMLEHEAWIKERTDAGWIYGVAKSVSRKISPQLVPYDQLTEEMKEIDREIIRQIPYLLGKIGMAIYVKGT